MKKYVFIFMSFNERKDNIRLSQTFGLRVVKLSYRQTETLRRARPVLGWKKLRFRNV